MNCCGGGLVFYVQEQYTLFTPQYILSGVKKEDACLA